MAKKCVICDMMTAFGFVWATTRPMKRHKLKDILINKYGPNIPDINNSVVCQVCCKKHDLIEKRPTLEK